MIRWFGSNGFVVDLDRHKNSNSIPVYKMGSQFYAPKAKMKAFSFSVISLMLAAVPRIGAQSDRGLAWQDSETASQQLPKPADGFTWRDFPNECIAIQVPVGWQYRERENYPTKTVVISPKFEPDGGYDSGFTLNVVVCQSEKEWKDAYSSALENWAMAGDEVRANGKPTFQKAINDANMQVLVIEGDMCLPRAPHPKEKYHVRTIMRAIPQAGLVYFYTIGARSEDWEKIWYIGRTMLDPIVFEASSDLANQSRASGPRGVMPPASQESRHP